MEDEDASSGPSVTYRSPEQASEAISLMEMFTSALERSVVESVYFAVDCNFDA
jgi:hypothetical protein